MPPALQVNDLIRSMDQPIQRCGSGPGALEQRHLSNMRYKKVIQAVLRSSLFLSDLKLNIADGGLRLETHLGQGSRLLALWQFSFAASRTD